MSSNMTYEGLLDTFDSFEAYLPFVTKKFDDDLWLKTRTENTTQAYKLYLSTLPNGIHKQEATANINKIKRQQEEKAEQERQEAQRQRELEEQRQKEQAIADDKTAYERAKRTNSKSAYEKYLKNFANGAYGTEAKAKVDHFRKLEQEEQARIQQQKEADAQRQREQAIANDHQAYESAKRTNTKVAYESYLRSYPYGLHKAEATTKLNEFLEVERTLAAQHQQELAAQQVKAQSEYDDHQAFKEAKRINTKTAYIDYRTKYSKGIHREEAWELSQRIYNFSGGVISDITLKQLDKFFSFYYLDPRSMLYIDFIEERIGIKKHIIVITISEAQINTYHMSNYIFDPSSIRYKKIFSWTGFDSFFQEEFCAKCKDIPINQSRKDFFTQKARSVFENTFSNYKFPMNESGISRYIQIMGMGIKYTRYGLIKENKIITQPLYKWLDEHSGHCVYPRNVEESYFYFVNENNHGIINSQGNIVFQTSIKTEIRPDNIYTDINTLTIYIYNRGRLKYGVVDMATGNITVYPEYDELQRMNDNDKFKVKKGLKSGIIDKYGEQVEKIKIRLFSI